MPDYHNRKELSVQTRYCMFCYLDFIGKDKFCSRCNFPINGTDNEKLAFIEKYDDEDQSMENYKIVARKGLYGFNLYAGLIAFELLFRGLNQWKYLDSSTFWPFIKLTAILLICLLLRNWSKSIPMKGFLTGSLFFLILFIDLIFFSVLDMEFKYFQSFIAFVNFGLMSLCAYLMFRTDNIIKRVKQIETA